MNELQMSFLFSKRIPLHWKSNQYFQFWYHWHANHVPLHITIIISEPTGQLVPVDSSHRLCHRVFCSKSDETTNDS